jgi:hypothetical protein
LPSAAERDSYARFTLTCADRVNADPILGAVDERVVGDGYYVLNVNRIREFTGMLRFPPKPATAGGDVEE